MQQVAYDEGRKIRRTGKFIDHKKYKHTHTRPNFRIRSCWSQVAGSRYKWHEIDPKIDLVSSCRVVYLQQTRKQARVILTRSLIKNYLAAMHTSRSFLSRDKITTRAHTFSFIIYITAWSITRRPRERTARRQAKIISIPQFRTSTVRFPFPTVFSVPRAFVPAAWLMFGTRELNIRRTTLFPRTKYRLWISGIVIKNVSLVSIGRTR